MTRTMTDGYWIEIKIGPMMEQPVWYWFEPLQEADEKTVLAFIGDFFGPPQIFDSSEESVKE